MASRSKPIFPMPEEPQHYGDYGFDPQMDYFQILEEAKRHSAKKLDPPKSALDSLHFKLQKPISKDDTKRCCFKDNNKTKKRSKWWKAALRFLKWPTSSRRGPPSWNEDKNGTVQPTSRIARPLSGPLYATESGGSGWSPSFRRRSGSRPSSGPLKLTEMEEVNGIPYLSLRDLTADMSNCSSSSSSGGGGCAPPAAMPIYLVT